MALVSMSISRSEAPAFSCCAVEPKAYRLGVPRKIVKCMLEHNGTDPVLLEEDERFTVRLLAGHTREGS
jgi:hypothetical protein